LWKCRQKDLGKALQALPAREAGFIEPLECLGVTQLPEGAGWVYEIKLDGHRAVAVNANGKPGLFSRNRKSFNRQYPYIVEALKELPANTVVDGEVVALDEAGRPSFSLLQHFRSEAKRICYFVFDLLVMYRGFSATASLVSLIAAITTTLTNVPRTPITIPRSGPGTITMSPTAAIIVRSLFE
jgi:ATP-dependent DNA ligase